MSVKGYLADTVGPYFWDLYPQKLKERLFWRWYPTGRMDKINDKKYLTMFYQVKLGRKPNWKNPTLYTEKLQWLKLYDRNPAYTKMVDKYEAKKYVASIIGEEHIIPTLGVWDRFEDIRFDELPNQFVLKCTHNSGAFAVCKDKRTFDKKEAYNRIAPYLQQNYFYGGREWPYKNVKPRIIAEKYIDTLGKPDSIEYKATCFDGRVGFITVCRGIAHDSFDKRTNDSFEPDFSHMPWYAYYKNSTKEIKKPEQWEELIAICEKLSKGVPCLRVDCYIIDGQIYFGELTFYTWSGFIEFTPEEWDAKLGACITLPEKWEKRNK